MTEFAYDVQVVVSRNGKPVMAARVEGHFPEPRDQDGETLIKTALETATHDYEDMP